MNRITETEAINLLKTGDVLALGRAADAIRRERYGDTATFLIDRNINYTNVCQNECRFCAFYCKQDDPRAYLLSTEQILEKCRETAEAGGTQVMIQGGLYPGLGLDYYLNMLRAIHREFPQLVIHSFTATEIQHFAKEAGLSIRETLLRLQDAGLASLPGGGAEILDDAVRSRVSPKKISTDDYLDVMRTAHEIGMESTATMVIGLGETMEQRIASMARIRNLQDETGGFRAFIMWTFQPGHTALERDGEAGEKVSAIDYMKTLALSRLFFDNIAHIQGSWVTQGECPRGGHALRHDGKQDGAPDPRGRLHARPARHGVPRHPEILKPPSLRDKQTQGALAPMRSLMPWLGDREAVVGVVGYDSRTRCTLYLETVEEARP